MAEGIVVTAECVKECSPRRLSSSQDLHVELGQSWRHRDGTDAASAEADEVRKCGSYEALSTRQAL